MITQMTDKQLIKELSHWSTMSKNGLTAFSRYLSNANFDAAEKAYSAHEDANRRAALVYVELAARGVPIE